VTAQQVVALLIGLATGMIVTVAIAVILGC
jgi:hypothetical protein